MRIAISELVMDVRRADLCSGQVRGPVQDLIAAVEAFIDAAAGTSPIWYGPPWECRPAWPGISQQAARCAGLLPENTQRSRWARRCPSHLEDLVKNFLAQNLIRGELKDRADARP